MSTVHLYYSLSLFNLRITVPTGFRSLDTLFGINFTAFLTSGRSALSFSSISLGRRSRSRQDIEEAKLPRIPNIKTTKIIVIKRSKTNIPTARREELATELPFGLAVSRRSRTRSHRRTTPAARRQKLSVRGPLGSDHELERASSGTVLTYPGPLTGSREQANSVWTVRCMCLRGT